MKIAVAKGDGIGPEIMDVVLSIFDAANVPLTYEIIEMGKSFYDKGFSTGMTQEAKETVESLGVLFKGPMETPKGKGVKSINVTARKTWSTYANRRHFKSLTGVNTVFSKAGIPIDLTIVRENIEGTYGGIEHMLTQDVALCRRLISRPGSMQVHRFAFEMAKKEGFKTVTCAHKANIMKLTDGLFLDTFYEVAKDYPEISANDIIVDDLAMKLVSKPQSFELVVLTNLQGDIMSDLCAGLVGGLGFAPSANIGDQISIFEAVHGTAPDIMGKNIANPTALLLSGFMLLRHLGLMDFADKIENALLLTLEQGNHTGDFGDKSNPSLSTTEFAEKIISNLGKAPSIGLNRKSQIPSTFHLPEKPSVQKMMASSLRKQEKVTGLDLFFESQDTPQSCAEILKGFESSDVKLIMISNRGTQVWPSGSVFTECVDQYRARFELSVGKETTLKEMMDLATRISEKVFVSSIEILRYFDNNPGYSLAQGQ
ncbi:MAG: NADP-dependent isocitrate dehydrogenase [Bacteroidia bacterium]|nr:NADP-dependent isocitrate dehydrogenase [Bacteroidia bacterium]MCF8426323.1 NADP-dependent isocitrate dehydrogenase [Bacteroidia bacterium]